MTYKQGDRVEFTEDYMSYANKGDKATVINVYESHAADVTLDKTGQTFYVWQSRFKPLEEGFKVGDKVRVHDRGFSDKSWWGTEGVIEEVPNPDSLWGRNTYLVKLTNATAPHLSNGYVASLSKDNLELVPAPVEKFKKGDKVKVVRYNKDTIGKPVGQVGEIAYLKNEANYYRVNIDGSSWLLTEGEIELVTEPKPFGFEDIQKGDTIRRTFKMQDGTLMIRQGVVSTIGTDHAVNKIGTNLAFAYDTKDEQVTLELVNRPEPEPEPELWENRKAGDRIVTYFPDGKLDRIFTKQEDGLWGTLVSKSGSGLGKGFVREDKDLGAFLNRLTEKRTLQLIEK